MGTEPERHKEEEESDSAAPRGSGNDVPGPSRQAIEWRKFLIETVICIVLVFLIVVIGLHASGNLLAGPSIVGLVAVILGILRRRADRDS
jgi:glycerol uptake facilitator-like aquaporin